MRRAGGNPARRVDAGAEQGDDVRCVCGNLVARWVDGRVEIKCRRCKRCIYLTPDAPGEEEVGDPP